jgi:hypothetical protein
VAAASCGESDSASTQDPSTTSVNIDGDVAECIGLLEEGKPIDECQRPSPPTTTTTTTTTNDTASICEAKQAEYREEAERRAVLAEEEEGRRAELAAAVAENSPNVGTTRAFHEAVLRELSKTEERLVRIEGELSELCS